MKRNLLCILKKQPFKFKFITGDRHFFDLFDDDDDDVSVLIVGAVTITHGHTSSAEIDPSHNLKTPFLDPFHKNVISVSIIADFSE